MPIHVAAMNNNLEIIKLLLKQENIDIKAIDNVFIPKMLCRSSVN